MIAVFDLDGTITRRDTLLPYVWHYLARRPWRLARLLAALPAAISFLFAGRDHGRLKAALVHHALGGETRRALAAWNAAYLPRVLAHELLADAVAAIEQHRRDGDALVLMSASLDLYVPDLGRLLGFDEIICTAVRWHGDVLDGALVTANRRGEEKARCLERLRAAHGGSVRIIAYGNSAADLPHLRLADRGILVNGSRAARAAAAPLGIHCVDWQGTWQGPERSKADRAL